MTNRYFIIALVIFFFSKNSHLQNDVKSINNFINNNWSSKNIFDCADFDIQFVADEDQWMEFCEFNKAAYCREFFSIEDEGNIVFFNAAAVEQLGYYLDGTKELIPAKEDWEILQNKLYSLPNQPGCHLYSYTTRNNCNHSRNGTHRYCSPDLVDFLDIPCSAGFVYMKNDEIVFEEGKYRVWCESTNFYTEFNLKNGSMKIKENIVGSNSNDSIDLDYAGYAIILKKKE